jgi:hypothetical protein
MKLKKFIKTKLPANGNWTEIEQSKPYFEIADYLKKDGRKRRKIKKILRFLYEKTNNDLLI